MPDFTQMFGDDTNSTTPQEISSTQAGMKRLREGWDDPYEPGTLPHQAYERQAHRIRQEGRDARERLLNAEMGIPSKRRFYENVGGTQGVVEVPEQTLYSFTSTQLGAADRTWNG
jgi:hypothetical protein